MKTEKLYKFVLNLNPTSKEVDEALTEVYKLINEGAKNYKGDCPLNFEELGSYVFNRVLRMLSKDGNGDWRVGMRQWMGEVAWKTVPSYIRQMLSSGFIDYTRSAYSEFRHKPMDVQEHMYVFDQPTPDEDVVTIEDVKELFSRLSTKERLGLYKAFSFDKFTFSTEFRDWFEAVSNPRIVKVESVYELTTNQVADIKAGLLAYRLPDGCTYYNIGVSTRDKVISLVPF